MIDWLKDGSEKEVTIKTAEREDGRVVAWVGDKEEQLKSAMGNFAVGETRTDAVWQLAEGEFSRNPPSRVREVVNAAKG